MTCYYWLMILEMFVTISLEKWYWLPVKEASDGGSTTVTVFDKGTQQISSQHGQWQEQLGKWGCINLIFASLFSGLVSQTIPIQ